MARAAACGVFLLICLAGLRMVFDRRLPAKWFDCTAALVFGLCVAIVVLTSPAWKRRHRRQAAPVGRSVFWVAAGATLGIYLLVVLGAQLRYPPYNATPGWFVLWVWLKLIAAGLVAAAVAWLFVSVGRRTRDVQAIVRPTKLLALLFAVQLLLGASVWVTNYNWPAWFRYHVWSIDYTPDVLGPLQVWTTTAHVAIASLNLGLALSLALWSFVSTRGGGD